jgi:hypothetical protein
LETKSFKSFRYGCANLDSPEKQRSAEPAVFLGAAVVGTEEDTPETLKGKARLEEKLRLNMESLDRNPRFTRWEEIKPAIAIVIRLPPPTLILILTASRAHGLFSPLTEH